ncbi:glycosyltransferase family 2 protein [Levilactobacillus suantsaii]|uniref:Glycosyltransferase n=1 Tax=Levilactobacillus suantsaii TaxID=2292255 RepID=A0A4Q0VHY9_9LACO|nr:glycosyltransferase family 2 protein [Levilactobacillus suantsaii]QMU07297.1 glycosyltransferase family 2 protein [Levilactobacillus suantsaii]RXI77906.1 glycosyltransferase [Levilactobacillus suantsaii]
MKTLSLVVPCYNEEESIPLFYRTVSKVIDTMNTPTQTVTPEYIFVDDGSSDQTLAEMKTLHQAHPETVHFRSFSRNFGKESALAAGLQATTGDLIAVMDVDLQDPPELLPQMFQLIENDGYDCVGTIQKERKGQSKLRAFLSSSFYRVINRISDVRIEPNARDYRLMTRQFVDTVLDLPEFNRFSKGIFSWVGFKTTYLTYESQPRAAGTTHWNLRQLFSYSIEGIIDFSNAPLRLATWVGSISFFLSLIGLIFVVVRALTVGGAVAGWPSLVVIVLLIGGIQLFCLGILGQYINKIYLETKHRPKYIVREEK